jgi:iduronate 2-sulfatase
MIDAFKTMPSRRCLLDDGCSTMAARRAVEMFELLAFSIICSTQSTAADSPNVLFVSVDDLRPEIGCYGNTKIKTTQFDQFAKRSAIFTRAYCQAAVCAPSLASVMTGLRPDSTRLWDLRGKFRENLPDVVNGP